MKPDPEKYFGNHDILRKYLTGCKIVLYSISRMCNYSFYSFLGHEKVKYDWGYSCTATVVTAVPHAGVKVPINPKREEKTTT